MTRYALIISICFFGSACNGKLTLSNGSDAGVNVDFNGIPSQDADELICVSCQEKCPNCTFKRVGIGTNEPFDPNETESEFVEKDGEGALIINKKSSNLNRYLWVADTALPGVVKIDLETQQIVGRYRTGGSSTSRTTVNALGEAFIGSRSDGNGKTGVTKILPLGNQCPDTNGDGKITTSTGPDDVLPWGQDDCVAWHTEAQGDIRGLATQDISGTQHDICKDFQGEIKEFDPKKIAADDQHYLWIGGLHGKIYKLDAKTGQILFTLTAPSQVYGLAISGDGRLWNSNPYAEGIGFIDTTKCTDQASCEAAPVCSVQCSTTSCPADCDGATKGLIHGLTSYGITVDYKQRVWMSGYPNAITYRYDPNAPADQRLATGPQTWGGGIAADANGFVWAANLNSNYLARINAETMASVNISIPVKGVAIDLKGRVYAVQYSGAVHLIEPGPTLDDYKLTSNWVPLKGIAYAYSDMTGVQARLASGEPGWYRHTFQGCTDGETSWKFFDWDVEVPPDTWAMFNMRTGATEEDLKSAPWVTIACISPPGGVGDLSIAAVQDHFVEIEVRFIATGDLNQAETIQSARIKSFGVSHQCEKID